MTRVGRVLTRQSFSKGGGLKPALLTPVEHSCAAAGILTGTKRSGSVLCMESDDKPIDRRRFFRAGLAELFKPLSKAMRPLEAMAHEIGKLEDPAPAAVPLIRRPQNTIAQGGRNEPSDP